MLLDANILLYARNSDDPHHDRARTWLVDALNGSTRVGFPWQTVAAFLRIATNPRAFAEPLEPEVAWQQVEDWLAAPRAWVPQPTAAYAGVLGRLVRNHRVRGPLVTDAALAALAIDHGVAVVSADADFARFFDVRWINPLDQPVSGPADDASSGAEEQVDERDASATGPEQDT
ncbi:MAG: PIN domain-containing protein [Actinobacteria bacterium]|nr:PIN domain-containing protein [Actinomycetota bacterium]